ncbi:MAG TPA: hypothetical protein VJK90_14730 [Acetobacteraceae bacterium]|nr:hypothetical protein [Acetobacteraceae bacterium]
MDSVAVFVRSIASGMHAAFLLARGRPEGLHYADSDLAGATRSFWAIAVALPAFICLRLLSGNGGVVPAHDFALDLLSYVIGWIGFALLSRPVVEAMGAAPHWPRFIVVWNWCNVVQYLLLVVASVPGLLGAPGLVQQAVSLVAIGWALWLEWFAIKLALEVSTPAALGLVGLDLSIGLALTALGQGLLAG